MSDSQIRIEALRRGHIQFGHEGRHHGNGTPECPFSLHHHHDAFCEQPTTWELNQAGVSAPENGWASRA